MNPVIDYYGLIDKTFKLMVDLKNQYETTYTKKIFHHQYLLDILKEKEFLSFRDIIKKVKILLEKKNCPSSNFEQKNRRASKNFRNISTLSRNNVQAR